VSYERITAFGRYWLQAGWELVVGSPPDGRSAHIFWSLVEKIVWENTG